MGALYWLAGIISTGSIVTSVLLHLFIYGYVKKSGIYLLDDSLLITNLISSFIVTVFSATILSQKSKNTNTIVAYIAAGSCICFFEFYIGLRLAFNPSIYLSSLQQTWKHNIDSSEIDLIQNKYRCCGFFKINDIPVDECPFKKPNSCFHSIYKNVNRKITTTGLAYLIISLIMFIVSVLLVIDVATTENIQDGSISLN